MRMHVRHLTRVQLRKFIQIMPETSVAIRAEAVTMVAVGFVLDGSVVVVLGGVLAGAYGDVG